MCIHWHWHLFNDTRTKKKIFFKCLTLHVYNAVLITFQIRVTLNIRQNSIVFCSSSSFLVRSIRFDGRKNDVFHIRDAMKTASV